MSKQTQINKRGTCKLCKETAALVEGHIVPSFVYRWLKNTSVTGFLRSGNNPNVRMQDGWKRRWFCRKCEDHMGRFERAFSERFFPLLVADTPGPYKYGPWLSRFAATVAWRTVLLLTEREDAIDSFTSVQKRLLPDALEYWRAFVRGEVETPGIHELHFVPMGLMDSFQGPKSPPPNLNRYAMRAIEISVPSTSTQAFAYVKMGPGVVLGFIQPPPPGNWEGTQIGLGDGRTSLRMGLAVPFIEYFMDRAASVLESERARSTRQQNKINETLEANSARAATSETIRAMEADVRMFGIKRVFSAEDHQT